MSAARARPATGRSAPSWSRRKANWPGETSASPPGTAASASRRRGSGAFASEAMPSSGSPSAWRAPPRRGQGAGGRDGLGDELRVAAFQDVGEGVGPSCRGLGEAGAGHARQRDPPGLRRGVGVAEPFGEQFPDRRASRRTARAAPQARPPPTGRTTFAARRSRRVSARASPHPGWRPMIQEAASLVAGSGDLRKGPRPPARSSRRPSGRARSGRPAAGRRPGARGPSRSPRGRRSRSMHTSANAREPNLTGSPPRWHRAGRGTAEGPSIRPIASAAARRFWASGIQEADQPLQCPRVATDARRVDRRLPGRLVRVGEGKPRDLASPRRLRCGSPPRRRCDGPRAIRPPRSWPGLSAGPARPASPAPGSPDDGRPGAGRPADGPGRREPSSSRAIAGREGRRREGARRETRGRSRRGHRASRFARSGSRACTSRPCRGRGCSRRHPPARRSGGNPCRSRRGSLRRGS